MSDETGCWEISIGVDEITEEQVDKLWEYLHDQVCEFFGGHDEHGHCPVPAVSTYRRCEVDD